MINLTKISKNELTVVDEKLARGMIHLKKLI